MVDNTTPSWLGPTGRFLQKDSSPSLTGMTRPVSVITVSEGAMSISPKERGPAWLLLVFTLPTAKASERVGVWRKLQRYGAVSLPASGYVLPDNSMNQERFEWLAASIRSSKGQAAIAHVSSFNNLDNGSIEHLFNEARSREYQALEKELRRLQNETRRTASETSIGRLKKRLDQIVEIDFFGSPARARVEAAMQQLESHDRPEKDMESKKNPKDYARKTWVTRPNPGIDRVSSAWLIRRFIDPHAKFAFNSDPKRHPKAIPFDMFSAGGFSHVGDNCTFETLVKSFGIRDARVKLLAEAIHDADLGDERFGRTEALGVDRILDGWNRQGIASEEVLKKGVDMIEGLYNGIR